MQDRTGNTVYELTMVVDNPDIGSVEILKNVLLQCGIPIYKIVESRQWPDVCLSLFFPTKHAAKSLKAKIKGRKIHNIRFRITRLLKRDWQTKWKSSFKPFRLTRSFDVVPIRMKKEYKRRTRSPIFIDTDLAFGTGLHPTTRFMAGFVERCAQRAQNVMDIGTGTGILAIIAVKCGVHRVEAVDICRDAIKVARANAFDNGCSRIRLRQADGNALKSNIRFDLVCANIITQDLIKMADHLIRLVKPGKFLAVSGISVNSYKVFRRAYARYPLRCVKIEKEDGWVGILYKRLI